MEQMRRVVVAARGEVVVESVATPVPDVGEVLVRSVFVGVCGSDTHALHGRHPTIVLPYAPGHEVVGVVERLGPDVGGVAAGDRVVVEPTLPCWGCKPCRTGRENLCENLDFFGCGHPQGGMADRFTVAAGRLHVIPESMDDLTASLIEPLSTPVHAARLAGELAGRTVVILGAGTIGLLLLAVVRAKGAARVVVSDVLESKRDLATRHGADAVVDAGADDVVDQVRTALGESADVVFDCVGIQTTTVHGVQMALRGGTVVVVGVPSQDVVVPLPVIQDQQVRIQGSATYLPEDYRASMALLASGVVSPGDFVTARYPLAQAAAAFDAASGGAQIKVLVEL